ncbi:MAG: hypothetical protein IJ200_02335, partial [Prevotella sp.]|nr:hypothetical protein [Prevotella sp.]
IISIALFFCLRTLIHPVVFRFKKTAARLFFLTVRYSLPGSSLLKKTGAPASRTTCLLCLCKSLKERSSSLASREAFLV